MADYTVVACPICEGPIHHLLNFKPAAEEFYCKLCQTEHCSEDCIKACGILKKLSKI
mgnify:CR=1 FL=1